MSETERQREGGRRKGGRERERERQIATTSLWWMGWLDVAGLSKVQRFGQRARVGVLVGWVEGRNEGGREEGDELGVVGVGALWRQDGTNKLKSGVLWGEWMGGWDGADVRAFEKKKKKSDRLVHFAQAEWSCSCLLGFCFVAFRVPFLSARARCCALEPRPTAR